MCAAAFKESSSLRIQLSGIYICSVFLLVKCTYYLLHRYSILLRSSVLHGLAVVCSGARALN